MYFRYEQGKINIRTFTMYKVSYTCILSVVLWNKYLVPSAGVASVEIVIPPAGNCGDATVLTCVVKDKNITNTGWFGLGKSLMTNGLTIRPEDSAKYLQIVNETSFSLTIRNTDIQDEGDYRCRVGFEGTAPKTLMIECKAKYINITVLKDRSLMVSFDSVYPKPQIKLDVENLVDGTETSINGLFRKECSLIDWLLACEWMTSQTVQDGNYSYRIAVTTITVSMYTGFFQISVPVRIQVSPATKSYYVEENKELNNVSCSAYCAPECQYIWSDGHGNNVSTSSLFALGKVDRADQGVYMCTAWNWFGKVSETISIAVLYGPEAVLFTPSDTTYITNEGDALEDIRCSVTCNPNCTIQWFKLERNEDIAVSNTGYLVLGNVKRRDAGVYKCVATNKDILGDPSIQKSLELNIRYGPDTVKLSSGSHVSLIVGEKAADISCSSECNPPCFFSWTNVNGSILSNSPILPLHVPKLAAQEEYRCIVSNNATGKTIYTSVSITFESSAQTQEGTPIGAIIGGVVGFVIFIGLVATIAFICYNRGLKGTLKTKEHAKTARQREVGQAEKETADIAYEDIGDRRESKKEDVYDELTVSVTDIALQYENTPK